MKNCLTIAVLLMFAGHTHAQKDDFDDANVAEINKTTSTTQSMVVRYVKSFTKYVEPNYKKENEISIGVLVEKNDENTFYNALRTKFEEASKTSNEKNPKNVVVELISSLDEFSQFDFIFMDNSTGVDLADAIARAKHTDSFFMTYKCPTEEYMIDIHKIGKKVKFSINKAECADINYKMSAQLDPMADKIIR